MSVYPSKTVYPLSKACVFKSNNPISYIIIADNCLFVCFFSLSKNETFVTYDEPESSIENDDLQFVFCVSIRRVASVTEVFSGFEFYLLKLH